MWLGMYIRTRIVLTFICAPAFIEVDCSFIVNVSHQVACVHVLLFLHIPSRFVYVLRRSLQVASAWEQPTKPKIWLGRVPWALGITQSQRYPGFPADGVVFFPNSVFAKRNSNVCWPNIRLGEQKNRDFNLKEKAFWSLNLWNKHMDFLWVAEYVEIYQNWQQCQFVGKYLFEFHVLILRNIILIRKNILK